MAIGMNHDAVYLSPAPLYHTAPCLWSMSALAMGATVVVIEKFDPEQTLDCIQRYRVTHGQFVPVMFVRMLKMPEAVRDSYDVSSLERVIHAAAPCPVEIKQQMIDWWGPDRRRVLLVLGRGGHHVHLGRRLDETSRLSW